jgi:dihydrolipoamide dehydrogenase
MLRASSKTLLARRCIAPAARSFSAGGDDKYDVVVVGGGPGGYVAAIKASQLGLKTACVESRGTLGGTCLNVGCIPSKALLHSTHLLHMAQHDFKSHGIKVSGLEADFTAMMKNKSKSVRGLTGGIEFLFKKYGVDYVKGFGKVSSANQVSVELGEGGNSTLNTSNILIATGSAVAKLPPCPVDNEGGRIVDSTGVLSLTEVPEKMVVVGGGVIGLEMGSVYSRLGAEVTVVEYLDRIVPAMDLEVGKEFMKILKKQKIKFKLSTGVVASDTAGDKVKLTVQPAAGGDEEQIEADVVLVSTGRVPFTEGLGLEEMGIQIDQRGCIEVDDEFRTAIPSIFAIGDCIAGPMLAHKAEEEGIAAVENMAGLHGHVNYNAIPGVVYTHPEVAEVGKTEEALKAEGVSYNKGVFPMVANSRARTTGDADGMVKILACSETDKILGIHIIGSNAGEMIAEGVLGIEYGASSEDIARTCHAHPTLSEAFKEACMATYDQPIHS